MGMFDRVWVDCPRCGNTLEFQSKGGECILSDFNLHTAPDSVLANILGDEQWCEQCKRTITIEGSIHAYPSVSD